MQVQWKSAVTAIGAALSTFIAASCGDASGALSVDRSALSRRAPADHGASGQPSTLQWNAEAITLASKYALNQTFAARAYMLVSVAESRALDALGTYGGTSDDLDRGMASRNGALGGAAVTVLTYLIPAEQADLEAMLASLRAAAPNPSHFDAAVAIGRVVAQGVVDLAATDGSAAVVIPVIPVGPGFWKSAGSVLTPQWPFVRPMLMTSGSQFRPAPPPAFGSADFLTALEQVRTFSDTRTPEQLAILNFWNDPGAVGAHSGHWNQIAVGLILRHNANERKAVHVLESLNLAMSDAAIACMDAKYTYWYIRPYQADPLITTPLGKPPHPSYPSLHACVGGAAVGVLTHEFPQDADDLEAMLAEMLLSREWAGLHYWFDVQTGAAMGRQVAALANSRETQ
jgi:membrane-associated phospholipid phosphatase